MQATVSIAIVIVFQLVIASSFSEEQPSSNTLPNIIFTMADDLGYGDVGYNGGNASTPNLDAMASGPHTIHLTRYYSGGPVCSPTRGTVLTGRNHNRYCIWSANTGRYGDFSHSESMPLLPSEVTVAEILKERGYQTAAFGKWHLGDLKKQHPGHKVAHPGLHGFDEWLVTLRSTPTTDSNCGCFEETKDTCPIGHYATPPRCKNYYTIKGSDGELEALPHPIHGDDSRFIVDQLEEYLKRATANGKPFFVYLPLHAVHSRYIATEEYARKYTENHIGRGKDYTKIEVDYYGALTAMDDAIGRIRDLLVKYGVSENTMLWFTSDNGPEMRSPGSTAGLRGRKRSLFEGGIRVPGLIEWPAKIKENRKTDFPVMSSDLLPTACDIVNTSTPTDRPIDGVSILPFIEGKTAQRNSTLKWTFMPLHDFNGTYQAAISGDRYKLYARYLHGNLQHTGLYDLTTDRFEQHDIRDQKEEVYKELQEELETWHKSVEHSARNVVKCHR